MQTAGLEEEGHNGRGVRHYGAVNMRFFALHHIYIIHLEDGRRVHAEYECYIFIVYAVGALKCVVATILQLCIEQLQRSAIFSRINLQVRLSLPDLDSLGFVPLERGLREAFKVGGHLNGLVCIPIYCVVIPRFPQIQIS